MAKVGLYGLAETGKAHQQKKNDDEYFHIEYFHWLYVNVPQQASIADAGYAIFPGKELPGFLLKIKDKN